MIITVKFAISLKLKDSKITKYLINKNITK